MTLLARPLAGWIAVAALGMSACVATSSAADAPPIPASVTTALDYNRSAPLELVEVGSETRDDARIRDITFVGAKKPVSAYLVTPAAGGESMAAILYVHWLGQRETTNRTEFLNEAIALANQGVVSLLVDAMWSQPKWYDNRVPEEDYARSIDQVIDLRRAMDLLLSQPNIDQKRVGFVGHDFGAMYGMVMGALDKRPTTYVFMAGTPHFIDWFLFARQPKSPDAYRQQLSPLDPINFVAHLSPAPVFFQFAAHDEYVSAETAAAFYAAARPRKQTAMYEAGHDLQKPEATADRISWLMRTLRLQR